MATAAEKIVRELNPGAVVVRAGDGMLHVIEDYPDPDRRWYRFQYLTTDDGTHAVAYCVLNPWASSGRDEYHRTHVANDGFLCLARGATRSIAGSPFSLLFAIQRARYWAAAYSYYRETGKWIDP